LILRLKSLKTHQLLVFVLKWNKKRVSRTPTLPRNAAMPVAAEAPRIRGGDPHPLKKTRPPHDQRVAG
jgi:hypothetical protein